MKKSKKSHVSFLPSDKTLLKREQIWLDIFERFQNAKDTVLIPVQKFDELTADEDPYDDDDDDSNMSDIEFVDNEECNEIDDATELKETSEKGILEIQRRVNKWRQNGFHLKFNSHLFDYSIETWLKANASPRPSTQITTTLTIREFSYSTTANMFDSNIIYSTPILNSPAISAPGFSNIRIPMSVPRKLKLKQQPIIKYQFNSDDTRNLYFQNHNVHNDRQNLPYLDRGNNCRELPPKQRSNVCKFKKTRSQHRNKCLWQSTLYFADQSSDETEDEEENDSFSDNYNFQSGKKPIEHNDIKPQKTESDSQLNSQQQQQLNSLPPEKEVAKGCYDIPISGEEIKSSQPICRTKRLKFTDSIDLKTILKSTRMDDEMINKISKINEKNRQPDIENDLNFAKQNGNKENTDSKSSSMESSNKSNGSEVSEATPIKSNDSKPESVDNPEKEIARKHKRQHKKKRKSNKEQPVNDNHEIIDKMSKIEITDEKNPSASSTTEDKPKSKKTKPKPKSKSKKKKEIDEDLDTKVIGAEKENEKNAKSVDSRNSVEDVPLIENGRRLQREIPLNTTYVVQKIPNQKLTESNSNDDLIFKKPIALPPPPAKRKSPNQKSTNVTEPSKQTRIPKPISINANGIPGSKEKPARNQLPLSTCVNDAKKTSDNSPIRKESKPKEKQSLKNVQMNDIAERCNDKENIPRTKDVSPQKPTTKTETHRQIPPESILVYSPSKCRKFSIRESDQTVSISIDHMIQTIGMANLKSLYQNNPFRKIRCRSNQQLWFVPETESLPPKWLQQ